MFTVTEAASSPVAQSTVEALPPVPVEFGSQEMP